MISSMMWQLKTHGMTIDEIKERSQERYKKRQATDSSVGPQRGPASLPRILAQVKQDVTELERAGALAEQQTVDEDSEVLQPQEGSSSH